MALCRPLRSVSLAIAARPARITGSSLSLLDRCRPLSEPLSWRSVEKARWRRTRMRCCDRRGCGGMVKADGHRGTRFCISTSVPRETRTQIHLRTLLETNDCPKEHVESHAYEMRRTLSGVHSAHARSLALSLALSATTSASERRISQDRKSTRLNSSHSGESRMPSSA